MQFEVIARCPTTKARVCRMSLSRESNFRAPFIKLNLDLSIVVNSDGTTILPTFMPVATQAAIKGLTPQQMESLGITLILNNTYHLNLRPGIQVLKEAGGAHKFQGWKRNLLTVRSPYQCFVQLTELGYRVFNCIRIRVASSLSL